MDALEPNLGANKVELQKLHDFAQDYLKEKADREAQKSKELQDMREELNRAGQQFSDLYAGMKKNETVSTPAGDGSHIVVKKSYDRLRMAHTTNPEKNLGGYLPTFDDISEWQEVTIDGVGGIDPNIRTVFHWNKQQLDDYKTNPSVYWGKSTKVRLGNFDGIPPDAVVQSFEEAKEIMKVPQELLDSVK